jgi:preprotein translocase SecE subunit
MIGKIKNFVSEVTKEMKKVSWPTKAQIRESTTVVIVTSHFLQ